MDYYSLVTPPLTHNYEQTNQYEIRSPREVWSPDLSDRPVSSFSPSPKPHSWVVYSGCMSYGSPKWQEWVLEEEESIKQIGAAYDLGINAFDTANVYSNGLSERILGKAIKQYKLPRDEIVVMTKLNFTVGRDISGGFVMLDREGLDKNRYVNVNGLSRKVRRWDTS